jgi:hypothetical protein
MGASHVTRQSNSLAMTDSDARRFSDDGASQ